jgi:hypothetical protein
MELELARRRAYELEINRKVEAMRAQLQEDIGREHEKRLTFNEQHYRYLPPNLKIMLEEPPARFDIYPKTIDHQIVDDNNARNEGEKT